MPKWISTKYPGVRYREHTTRNHGIKKDKYFAIRYQKDGKRKEEGLGWASCGWTLKKAVGELERLKHAATTGEGPTRLSEKRRIAEVKRQAERLEQERLEKENLTFGQYFTETYLPIAKTNKKITSYKTEKDFFRNWLGPVLEKHPLKKIKSIHLERVKSNMLKAGRTPRSIQYVLATFRQVWNMARRDGLVSEDSPTRQVKIPKIDNRRIRFLTHDEADRLLDHLKGRSVQLYNMSLLSLYTGMRAGEIFSLTWGCVDIERGLIQIMDPKGGKNRSAFMTEEVKAMFRDMEPGYNGVLVFPDRNGNKIKAISKVFFKAVNCLGLNSGVTDDRQKVVFHTLRHTFASWLVENGTDLYTVKELMGHSTLAMTERYSHVGENSLRTAINGLQEHISSSRNEDVVINIKVKK